MKKVISRRLRLAVAICLLLAALLPAGGALAETALATGTVNSAKLNMREGAGTGHAMVATLTRGTAVNVYQVSGTWLRIDVPSLGKSGYVSGKYITLSAGSLSAYGLGVTSGKVHLRKQATSKSDSLGIVPLGVGLTVYSADQTTGWYKVKVHDSGTEGYISPRYIKIVCKVDKSGTSGGTTGTSGTVSAGKVHLRKGPGTNNASLGLLTKNTPVTVLGSSGDWYKVTVVSTGKTGYVFARYIAVSTGTVTPAPGSTATPAPGAGSQGFINRSGVNFRTGPATSYANLGKLSANTSVTVTGNSGSWCQVTVPSLNKSGYVYASYVTLTSASVTPAPFSKGPGKINVGSVNFRTGPSTKYVSLGILGGGTEVTVLEASGNWYKVTLPSTGKTGYVFASYVTMTGATPSPSPTPSATPSPTPTATPTATPSTGPIITPNA